MNACKLKLLESIATCVVRMRLNFSVVSVISDSL